MIAKIIPSKRNNSRMAGLVKYVVNAEGGLDPRSWARTADYMLCSSTNKYGEKVGGVRVTNCHTDDPAAATTLIEITQAVNTRSKTDKTYHLVFAFPPGEEPDIKTLYKIEDELVKSLGFEDHQRISAVHIDTEHLHVHVAINKVHPVSFNNISPSYDKKKLMATCERLEIEYGLQRTNHGLTGQRNQKEREQARIPTKQAQAEAHSGVDTLIGHITREVAQAMHKAKNWQELHTVLSSHGLQIKPRGAGLVIGNGTIWAKASQCDRSFSMKGLTDKFGSFEKPTQQKEFKPYEPQPQQNHPSSAVLFDQYQREKARAKIDRDYGMERIKYESAVTEANLKRWVIAQKLFIKATPKGPKRTAALKIINLAAQSKRRGNWSHADKMRKQVFRDTATPNWVDWLAREARAGNTEAMAVLRNRKQAEAALGNTLSPSKINNPLDLILRDKAPNVDSFGRVTYNTPDGGIVIDRKSHVQAFRTTAASTLLALELAGQRFKGQALIVEGREDFQKEIMLLAKERGISVRLPSKPRKRSIEDEVQL